MSTSSTTAASTAAGGGDNIDDIRSQKQTLRRHIRQKLKTMSTKEVQQQSVQVWERLQALPAYQTARSIGFFLSMPTAEIQTATALQQALQKDHKTLYVPRVGTNFEQADMELIRVDVNNDDDNNDNSIFYDTWPRNKWGIPEPPVSNNEKVAQPGDLDLVVVPGLAFDRAGHRLGQGKGYYDRFLERMIKPATTDTTTNMDKESPTLVAVALQCQLLDSHETVPTSSWDRLMDVVLVPSETILVTSSHEDNATTQPK